MAALVLLGGVQFARFALAVRRLAARHATGPAWSFPSRVWSDGLPLVPGRALPEEHLRAELEARDYREVFDAPQAPGEWSTTPDGVEIVLRGFRAAADPAGHGGPERVRVQLAHGRVRAVRRLGGVRGAPRPDLAHPPRLEPVRIATLTDSTHVRREYVPLARMPLALRAAAVASEDRRFRSHWGLDLRGDARALAANLRAGAVRQGASTITQQLARGLFLGSQRTLGRKLAEIPLALGLELLLSKDQILEMYLNSVYFGRDDAGGYAGVAEASRRLFGTAVDSLSLAQAATLVGVIPAPNLYSPLRRPDEALRRRHAVLNDLYQTRALPTPALAGADAEGLDVQPLAPAPDRFPSFVAYVRQALAPELPRGALEGWGLDVFTTLDPVWQATAERELAAGVGTEETWHGLTGAPLEGAFVLLDNATGEVRALVGGRDARPGDFNRATQALRQPGSAIKPIVYAAALDPRRGGRRLTPATTVPDLRRVFVTPDGLWKPRNDEGEYHDSVTLAKALAKSLNLATANLVERIGAATVARYAERFGLGRPAPVASIGLGTQEVTPLALADAYTTFPNAGWRLPPTPVRAVVDGRGRRVGLPPRRRVDVLDPDAAALVRGLLEDVVIFGIAYPLRAEFGFSRPCGGKTGTTNDYRDAWFVGFTPELTAALWVGYDAPRPLGRPAAKVAIPIWAQVMNAVLAGFPPAPFPARREETLAWIDPWTGGLARPDCPSPMRVPFLRGSEPRTPCTRDHTADWAALRARALAPAAADTVEGPF
ncbi:MAG TPA: transglycosylase domain-containing protein [Candidatus Eisenbacteria bacterium]|nr:transglycosylase domain-containing protein [Candidatus Eisenbacteria bacterium]